MIINTIYDDIIEGNNLRINNIKSNREKDFKSELELKILNNNLEDLKQYLQQEIFFEKIQEGLLSEMLEVKRKHVKNLASELHKSYQIRGIHGIRFSWELIIKKYASK